MAFRYHKDEKKDTRGPKPSTDASNPSEVSPPTQQLTSPALTITTTSDQMNTEEQSVIQEIFIKINETIYKEFSSPEERQLFFIDELRMIILLSMTERKIQFSVDQINKLTMGLSDFYLGLNRLLSNGAEKEDVIPKLTEIFFNFWKKLFPDRKQIQSSDMPPPKKVDVTIKLSPEEKIFQLFQKWRAMGFTKQTADDYAVLSFNLLDEIMRTKIEGFAWSPDLEKYATDEILEMRDHFSSSLNASEAVSFLEALAEDISHRAPQEPLQSTDSKPGLSESDFEVLKAHFKNVLTSIAKDTPKKDLVLREKLAKAFRHFLDEYQIDVTNMDDQAAQQFSSAFQKLCAMYTNQWSPGLYDASISQETLIDELVTIAKTFLTSFSSRPTQSP